ncbi:MAG: hypothetical protein ACR2PF_20160 [Rhizobiaceae bacterium]
MAIRLHLDLEVRKPVRNTAIFAAITTLAVSATFPTSSAGMEKCVLEGTNLTCGDRKATRADYFQRFSNPETTTDLVGMLDRFPLFENGKQRESYRRSLERVWRAVTRHGREQKRRYRRRQLSNEAYKQVEANFEQARKSYDAGINLYRHHIWMQKKPPKPDS